ncbi:zinc-dependent metalloprotease family protein [Pseudomonas putida]|jgi:predicted Zn-dependent protease|uniref:Reprolysin-like metallo-peptidase family M12B n=2 Tax=Pseudomonas putida group TaxID=136845 RepID=A0A2N1IXU4_9PSED|nr:MULTISPECIES: zinc-dependent metalloprotease family protein [Pseudomonas]EKT4455081.1 hypothetical protein [Pseudomonas putida]EKT4470773.1 hypothetical protein [Pseudomonas putida]EKT4493825.1 hypothetical protein [Pseudomonas putida]EKT4511955.1 hypothetical protein [Pseudomonas putida]EKT4529027.1 hypothetical protein [Pseudomonas putida]
MKTPCFFALSFGLALSVQLPSASAAQALTVTVYVHDDLADMHDGQLNEDFFQHWLNEMRSFSQHPVEVIFQRNIKHITDIAYAGMPSEKLLDAFSRQVYAQKRHRLYSLMDKHLLLTRNSYDHSGLNYNAGLAYLKQKTAIASVAAYGAAAHEIGHLLGATHEDAELKFNGWVCETYTHPRVPARSNCYRYSDRNRANITDYLKENSK